MEASKESERICKISSSLFALKLDTISHGNICIIHMEVALSAEDRLSDLSATIRPTEAQPCRNSPLVTFICPALY